MIFNRTAKDVADAIDIRTNVVQQGLPLTNEQAEILERGMLTVSVLNRVENKQAELYEELSNMGYHCKPITTKNWEIGNHFTDIDFQRLLDNLAILRSAFFVYSDTPSNPMATYYFENLNSLEKILYDLGVRVDDVKSYYRECGTFECGEE